MARVMVVDDSADVRLLLGRILRSARFTVATAESGGAALARLVSGEPEPDAVVLDVQMPELDGWDTLARIRKRSDVPVILCTVKGRPVDRVRGWQLGCDGYLTKPFDMDALVSEVREVCARSELERPIVRQTSLSEARREATAST